MRQIDWRELYASNRAAIERGGGPSATLATTAPLPVSTPRAEEGESWITAEGARRALVHAPPSATAKTALPLVCMLHGCTQDAAALAQATLMNEAADRLGFVVVYPQQELRDNQQSCWNWFMPEHQARGAGEPAAIAQIVREVIGTTSSWTIDTRRVFVAGLSAGGAMAAILAATYPDVFAALAVHSGLAYGSATNMGDAFSAMAHGGKQPTTQGRAAHAAMGGLARPVPTAVIHGTADGTVAPVNGRQVLQQWMTANSLASPESCDLDIARPSESRRAEVAGGHAYSQSRWTNDRGALMHELLEVDGLGHAWSGGAPGRPYSDPNGPDATGAILRFFADATAGEPVAGNHQG